MDALIYYFGSALIAVLQAFPLNGAARIGRFFGALVYYLDGRHRGVAIRNLTMCFGAEKSPAEIRALAKENFKRIGENFVCPIKLLAADPAFVWERLEVVGAENLMAHQHTEPRTSIIMAIGHFGNFELFAKLDRGMPSHRHATTYRAFNNKGANRLLLKLRNRTACLYLERRTDGSALRAALRGNDILLGLLSDQHPGRHGVQLPFLGHDCYTSKAPAVFALRYNAPLHVGICYRISLARWRIEVGKEIPTHENGEPRTIAAIMKDVNSVFEAAIRRDPANWFWVHNRWKNLKYQAAAPEPVAATSELEG